MDLFLTKASALWQYKPVQAAAKTLGLGALSYAAYASIKFVKGSKDASLKIVKPLLPYKGLDELFKIDPEAIEFLCRLEPFQRFSPLSYKVLFMAMLEAAKTKKDIYNVQAASGLKATSSFTIREAYQKVIEGVRLFRAVLESKLPTALDDFDEVAVEINAHVESVCIDALHDSLIH
jgi:hypothetical protein